jgi:hypothetical protein
MPNTTKFISKAEIEALDAAVTQAAAANAVAVMDLPGPFTGNREAIAAGVAAGKFFENIDGSVSRVIGVLKFAAIGDSITDRMSVGSTIWGNHISLGLDGWGAALEIFSGHRCKSLARPIATTMTTPIGFDRDWAYSGSSAKQWMLGSAAYGGSAFFNSHVPYQSFLNYADDADVCIVHFGANDEPGVTPAQRAQRIIDLWAALRALGKRVIGADILPRASNYSGGWTTAQQAPYDETNTILRAAWQAAGLWSYRQWADLIPRDGNNVALPVDFPTDGLHPTQRLGLRLGKDIYDFLAPYLPGNPVVAPAQGNAAWITPNPYVTGGTTLATSWVAQFMGTLGDDYTTAKVTDSDGRVWQRVTRLTAVSAENAGLASRLTTGLPAAGTVCRICARLRLPDPGAASSLTLQVQQVGVTPAWNLPYSHGIGAGVVSPIADTGEVFLYSEPFTIQSGITRLDALIGFRGTGAWTLDFREAGIIALPSEQ